jgi:indole-3-acetate monooxygenase
MTVQETDVAEYLARVARTAPAIQKAAEQVEAGQELPADLLGVLHAEKLFRLALPKVYGGEEVDPPAYFEIVSALAEHDASTAWCIGQANGCAIISAFLDADVADEIWTNDPAAVIAWGPGSAEVEVRDDGYVVTGTWRFASGSHHATWLGGRTTIELPDGSTIYRAMLFPADKAERIDIWNVMGMRGTGSDGYSVKDLFVPKNYAIDRNYIPEERRYNEPLFFIPSGVMHSIGFAGVALGVARSMLDEFIEVATEKKPYRMRNTLAENQLIQSDVATSHARISSARAYMLNETREVWADVIDKGELTMPSHMRLRIATTYSIHEAKAAVDTIYDAVGATAIFKGSRMERRFRDMHTLTQQSQGRKTHFQAVGAFLLGLDPELPPPM